MGSVAKSYMRMGFLICEEMRKYLTIHEERILLRRLLIIYEYLGQRVKYCRIVPHYRVVFASRRSECERNGLPGILA
jgi:hypothetical protein